jgi:hypothetical protein
MLIRYGCFCSRSPCATLSMPSHQKPSHRFGGRDITAIPRPGVPGSPLRIAVKKGPHLVGAAKKRCDHDDVGIWYEQLHNAVGIPRREPGAETLEDLEQRGLRLRIRPHDQGILASFWISEREPRRRRARRALFGAQRLWVAHVRILRHCRRLRHGARLPVGHGAWLCRRLFGSGPIRSRIGLLSGHATLLSAVVKIPDNARASARQN